MELKGISVAIVDKLVEKSNFLSQGREAGAIGFVNQDGYIDAITEIVGAGISGLPYRKLLSQVVDTNGYSLLEVINQLPDNIVLITTKPGKTGIILGTGGLDIFNCPMVAIGVKQEQEAGVGYIIPKEEDFRLASKSELIRLERLTATTMDEERDLIRKSVNLDLKYLDICQELKQVDIPASKVDEIEVETAWEIPDFKVESIDRTLAQELVDKSISVEQGREVAMIALIEDGHVVKKGEIVVGGMGYVPSRMLASSYTDISGISLKAAYSELIPNNVAIVHTHPGGTGVMHRGDAMAGPGTWGRPIIAIGHDKDGEIKGATVIEVLPEVANLAEEYEKVSQKYYEADTPAEEAEIRKRRFGISQEYTDLCKAIEIK